MQAILKNNHQRFIDWVGDVKMKRPHLSNRLDEMEVCLQNFYLSYHEKLEELKQIANEYVEIQKTIRNEVKKKNESVMRKVLHGHEKDEDFHLASRVARAVSWADVFLYSRLPRDLVEDLSMVPIEKPEQARRLAAQVNSASFLSFADRTRVEVQDAD